MKHVVIVGGGFGGFFTAHRLLKSDLVKVTVINPRDQFLFTPLVHEVATGSLAPSSVAYGIEKHLRGPNFRFIKGSAKKINLKTRQVWVNKKPISYDYLVIATGAKTNFYGNQSAQKNSLTLKSIEDSIAIKKRILKGVKDLVNKKAGCLCMVVVGGGATGVELTAEAAQFLREVVRDYPELKGIDPQISIVQSPKRLLAHESIYFQKYAAKRLKELGVTLWTGRRVEEVTKDAIVLNDGTRVHADIVVWTAGIAPVIPSITPSIESNACGGRLPVRRTLQLQDYDEVCAIGDCAACPGPTDFVPALAQTAVSQSKVCADNITRSIEGKSPIEFKWKSKGFLLSLGKGHALAEIGSIRFQGLLAWWFWRTVYLMKLPGIKNKFSVMCHWTAMLFKKREH